MPTVESPTGARNVIGLDVGATNARVQVASYDASGALAAEPLPLPIEGSGPDGALPVVMELDEAGDLLALGLPALRDMAEGSPGRFVTDFAPSLGQTSDDLAALGRPAKARYCSNARCPHPGWAWPWTLRFCGFCGGALLAQSGFGADWHPPFPFTRAEAFAHTRALLTEVARRVEARIEERPSAADGWLVSAAVPAHWRAQTRTAYATSVPARLSRGERLSERRARRRPDVPPP